jgi:acyl-coenzyme A synthetase/AMP-(fatty) acid ligase/thioesterase domain-containing protein
VPIAIDTQQMRERPADGSPARGARFERFDESVIEQPIFAQFIMAVARQPDKLAIDDGAVSLTYRELQRAAQHLAQRIEAVVLSGHPVGVLLPHGALFPIAALACLAIRRVYVPIDLSYPGERNDQIMREAGLAALIVAGGGHDLSRAASELPQLDIAQSLLADGGEAVAIAQAEGPAVVLYTSGSSGRPKGICNDERAILHRVAHFTVSCQLSADDHFILLSSAGTIAGVRDTLAALLNGATLHIADPHRLGAGGILRVLEDKRITVWYTVSALLRELLRLPQAKMAARHLRVLRLGGDAVLATDIELCRAVLPADCQILVGYGSTEVPTIFQWIVPSGWIADTPRIPCGYAAPGNSIALIKDDGDKATRGEIGELVVKSRYVALGAWEDGRLQPGPIEKDESDPSVRTMRTGDLVRRRDDGLWELVGRKDRMIKIRGFRVDPSEVEWILRESPGVADAAVIGRGSDGGTALIAYVVPRPTDTARLRDALRRAMTAKLPSYMRPTQLHFVPAIPRLPGFKPDLEALRKLETPTRRQGTGRGCPPPPIVPSPVRHAIENAWIAVLDRGSFAADMPFDLAGGDSLAAMRLWFIIEETLGTPLPIDTLQFDATPSQLADAIETLLAAPSPSPTAADEDTSPHVFLMPAYEGDVPMLAHFRAAFTGRIRFTVIRYPGWREMIDAAIDFDAIATASVAQIRGQSGGKPALLIGYSYGGFVAWEVARRLICSGEAVAFVGLIDSRRAPPGWQDKLVVRVSRIWNDAGLLRKALGLLFRLSAFRVLRALGRLAMLLPTKAAFAFHTRLIAELRLEALRAWTFERLPIGVTLFTTYDPQSPHADYGWRAMCDDLTVIPIGGSHTTVFEPLYRDVLCNRLLEKVTEAARASGAIAKSAASSLP